MGRTLCMHVWALIYVGVLHYKGLGVPQDYAEAYKWYDLAASRATDEKTRSLLSRNRDNAAMKLPFEQVVEAQEFIREWNKTHPQ